MNELHILDVGRADCTVLLLDTPQGRKCIVMDAGSCSYQGGHPLLSFLREKRIHQVDTAILTHLHQDHFGGFTQLIGQIPVEKMLTPCGDLLFDQRVYPIFGDREYYREYHQIFSYLAACKTELVFPNQYGGKTFPFGSCTLQCLWTEPPERMESVTCAKALCRQDLREDAIGDLLERHKRACNRDSSIWILRQGMHVIALLAGDSTDDNMRQALRQAGPIHPVVQKLSHHGLGDGYFSAETQAYLRPQTLVVSVDASHCGEFERRRLHTLCSAGRSKLHCTWQGPFSMTF